MNSMDETLEKSEVKQCRKSGSPFFFDGTLILGCFTRSDMVELQITVLSQVAGMPGDQDIGRPSLV